MLGAGDSAARGAEVKAGEAAGASRLPPLACSLLTALLFLSGIGSRDLWNPDEPRYAEVTREMLARGDWLVPHLNGEVYSHKPPLLFWAIGAAALLLRAGTVDEVAARLPSALAAIAATLVVYKLGDRLFGRRAAWIGALAFATSVKVLWQGRVGQIDMLLVALVAAAMWFWVRARSEGKPRLVYLFWLCAGVATLAKGPVGLLPPLLAILAFAAWERDPSVLRELRIGVGLAIYAGVVLAWLLPATLRGGFEYLEQIAFRQTVTRYAEPWHHFQPWYYYLGVVPADFFPWSLFLPAAAVVYRRREDPALERHLRFALCWIVVTVVFFSLSAGKRSVYVLTMYPALALLVGAALDRAAAWIDVRRLRRATLWPFAVLCGLVLAAFALLPQQARRRGAEIAALGDGLVTELTAVLALLLMAAAAAWWLTGRGRVEAAVGTLAGGMGFAALVAGLLVLPRFDAVKSARGLSEQLVRRSAPGEPYAIYPRIDPSFVFYTRRFCELPESEEALRRYASREGRRWLLITKREARTLSPSLPLVEVARDPDEPDGYLLLGPG